MKFLVTIGLVLTGLSLHAQYLPNNSQAFQFASLYNPAFTGIENYQDLKLSYRYQWSGFGANAPKFINLTYNMRLKQPLDLSYNALRISDPSLLKADRLPRGKQIIHGLGGNVFHSQIGPLETIGLAANYSISYPLTNKIRLAGGAGLVVQNGKVDINNIYLGSSAVTDDVITRLSQSGSSQTDFNVRAGFLLYGRNFYFGGSYLPLFSTTPQSTDGHSTGELALGQAFYRATLQTGLAFQVNPDLTFKPSIWALLQMDGDIAIDYNIKAYVQDKIWFGVGYRDIQSGVAMMGFNFNEKFTASYSYELSLGDFQQFSDGSHELVLAVRFRNFKKLTQYTW
jgi:type IX secretion system PorP/SprF family membrane protein